LILLWKYFQKFGIFISLPLFLGTPKGKKSIDYTKKLPTDGRPLYLDAQATTPMVSLLRTLSLVRSVFIVSKTNTP
jgi:hypothetical protein